jgi:hypothetical protein
MNCLTQEKYLEAKRFFEKVLNFTSKIKKSQKVAASKASQNPLHPNLKPAVNRQPGYRRGDS